MINSLIFLFLGYVYMVSELETRRAIERCCNYNKEIVVVQLQVNIIEGKIVIKLGAKSHHKINPVSLFI